MRTVYFQIGIHSLGVRPDSYAVHLDTLALISDCADAYTELEIHFLHMFECLFFAWGVTNVKYVLQRTNRSPVTWT